MSSRIVAAVAVVLAGGNLAACSTADRSGGEVERRSVTAGTVMGRGYDAIPARFAAAGVTGRDGPVTVDALEARGTSRGGRVVLRIADSGLGGDGTAHQVTRCYRYDFAVSGNDGPHRIDCGTRSPIRLPDPRSLPTVDQATVALALRTVAALPAADRRDAGRVRTALVTALGPSYRVATDTAGRSGVWFSIRAADTCTAGITTPIGITSSGTGIDCRP